MSDLVVLATPFGPIAVPVVRVGRYVRFDIPAVLAALDRRSTEPSIGEKRESDPRLRERGFTPVSIPTRPDAAQTAPRVRPGNRPGTGQERAR